MKAGNFYLYFPRWRFSYNLGDTVMLSCLFKAIKEVYKPKKLVVVGDQVVVDTFLNDPYVDKFRSATWIEKKIFKRRTKWKWFGSCLVCIEPTWQYRGLSEYFRTVQSLDDLIKEPNKNILSINYALQVGAELLDYPDLRPRIYLTKEEIQEAKDRFKMGDAAIGIHPARIRHSQLRLDGDHLRLKRSIWEQMLRVLKERNPKLVIYELGTEEFQGIGDRFVERGSIRELAAVIENLRLVILSDGGVHHVCNSISKTVYLFQGYEYAASDLCMMTNGVFDEDLYPQCRRECDLFAIFNKKQNKISNCTWRYCYEIDPTKMASSIGAMMEKQ